MRLVPNLLQYAYTRAGLEDLDGTPVINLSHVSAGRLAEPGPSAAWTSQSPAQR